LYDSSRAKLICLIISDVVGDDLDSIASGPTVADTTTFKDAIDVLKKYNLYEKIPISVKNILEVGLADNKLENPKPGSECFSNIDNYIIGSVKSATKEIISYLNAEGYKTNYFSDKIVGEAEDFGRSLYPIITSEIESQTSSKLALIGSGELTVTIKGNGIGGRNQEMLLSFLNYVRIKDIDYQFLIMGVNLDGIEGNSEAMGALIDNHILFESIQKDLNLDKFLNTNDSNSFFKYLNCELISGPTGCNVNDLVLIIIHKE
jgi:glycerate-2-kinase